MSEAPQDRATLGEVAVELSGGFVGSIPRLTPIINKIHAALDPCTHLTRCADAACSYRMAAAAPKEPTP